METSTDIERCGLASGEDLCVLKKGHEGEHRFRDVPVLEESDMFEGGSLWNSFCPYCGSRPLWDGPGCKECDADALDDENE